jgi:hypothetical protein
VIYLGLQDFLPADPQPFDFVSRNVRAALVSRGREAPPSNRNYRGLDRRKTNF